MPAPTRVAFTVDRELAGRRLDQALAARVPGLSRRQARVLLDIGGVFVDGRRLKIAGHLVRKGEEIVAISGGAMSRATKRTGRSARAGDERRLPAYRIVHEDDDVIVVDKPSGLLTAPTPESDRNNLADLLSRRPGAGPVQVVHRIDLETSGLVVFAKSATANVELSARFRDHDIERAYLAVVQGVFPDELKLIDRPVAGRRAVTHLEVKERFGQLATLLGCRLETGRTHQIRLHAAAAGHAVLGDERYGGPAPGLPRPPRMALHATRLGFVHPTRSDQLNFESPWPDDLAAWLVALRGCATP